MHIFEKTIVFNLGEPIFFFRFFFFLAIGAPLFFFKKYKRGNKAGVKKKIS